jgi:threonine synthase
MTLIQQFTARHPELVLVNSKNDMRIVGQESIGLEILQDLSWRSPKWIAVPVGNGGNLSALLQSLLRAKEFGLITELPGIIAAQTGVSDTLVRWSESNFQKYEPGAYQDTVASAMNINSPVSFPRIKKLYDNNNSLSRSAEPSDTRSPDILTMVEVLAAALQIMGRYSSRNYRKPLSDTAQKCGCYTETYRNLQKLFNTRSPQMNIDFIAQTMDTIRPVLGSRNRPVVEKLLRIYNAVRS